MDEIKAAEIRQWAWEQCSHAQRRDNGEAATYAVMMRLAEELAAWAMSGKLPDPVCAQASAAEQ